MSPLMISTASLDLVLQTPEEVLAVVEALPPADRAEVSPEWVTRVRSIAAGDPWALAFKIVERASRSVIGSCAFKGPPDANGIVEISYGIVATHRGRGFATEATNGLTRFAFASGRVQLVCAHTKPDNGASARVLAKCAFHLVGEVSDPEDGIVHRWEMPRGTSPDT
jgi:[ribosomal protein S5]-alanine N-acetyltransferase